MCIRDRDWAAECTAYPREICEHALGHVEGSASEQAYRRTDYFDRRRELMQEWADYVSAARLATVGRNLSDGFAEGDKTDAPEWAIPKSKRGG